MDNTRTELLTEEQDREQTMGRSLEDLENVLALPAGTVLDGRYRVVRVIRQGGFGITYEAVHMQSGERCAVKEYFCREICVRLPEKGRVQLLEKEDEEVPTNEIVRLSDTGSAADPESTGQEARAGSVTVADPANLPRFEADRARFLREARILREFAQEPSVVTVLDYFEENGTAYIVMEYLDAKTLREDIRDDGVWSMETVVHRFGPVMEVLARIHAAGVLHRDISPDNLMVLPDRSLKLIDFGAAREMSGLAMREVPDAQDTAGRVPGSSVSGQRPAAPLSSGGKTGSPDLSEPGQRADFSPFLRETTHSAIYTVGYSAPEQRDPRGVLGSWTDVYGLCGVIWFCLVGRDPEDALSRLLYDELERPSDLGVEILPRAEQVLMQGMALDMDSRIPDMSLLKEELQKYYPQLTDLEKERKKEQKRRNRRRLCAAAAGVLVCLGLVCTIFRTQIRFQFIETQLTALDGSSMTAEEFAINAEAVKRRVEALAGKGNYLWKEREGQTILFEVPAAVYENSDLGLFTADVIASRNRIRIYVEEWKADAAAEVEAVPGASEKGEAPDRIKNRESSSDQGTQDPGQSGENEDRTSWAELCEEENAPVRTEEGLQRFGYYRLGLFDQSRDVEGVRSSEEGTEISFTEEAGARFRGALEDRGRKVLLTFDDDNNEFAYEEGVITGDGRNIWIQRESTETVPVLNPHAAEFDALWYTEKPLSAPFAVECVWRVRWEKAEGSLLPGRNQVDAEAVPAPYIDLSYQRSGDFSDGREVPGRKGYNAALLGAQTIFKNRLDGMEIPYAIGLDQYAPSRLVVRLPADGICREDVENLGSYFDFRIGDGKSFSDSTYLTDCSLEVEEKADKGLSLALVVPQSRKQDIEAVLAKIEKREGERVFLYTMDRGIASADLSDAVRSIEQEARISFVYWPFSEDTAVESAALSMLRFLSVCKEQNPDHSFFLRDMQFTDRDGVLFFRSIELPALYPNPGTRWAQQWNLEHVDSDVRYDEREKELYVSLYERRFDDPASGLDGIWSVFQQAEEAQIPVQEVCGVLYEKDRRDHTEIDPPKMYIFFKRDFDSGGMQISRGYPSGFAEKDLGVVSGLCNLYNAFVRQDPMWKGMLTGYRGDTPFVPDY